MTKMNKSSLMTVLKAPRTHLCWHADRSLHLQVLLFSPSDEVSTDCGLRSTADTQSHHICPASVTRLQLRIAYTVTRICLSKFCPHSLGLWFTPPPPKALTLLQRLDIAAGEGDADAVNGHLGLHRCLTGVFKSLHVENMFKSGFQSHRFLKKRFRSFQDRFLIHLIDQCWQSRDKSG